MTLWAQFVEQAHKALQELKPGGVCDLIIRTQTVDENDVETIKEIKVEFVERADGSWQVEEVISC